MLIQLSTLELNTTPFRQFSQIQAIIQYIILFEHFAVRYPPPWTHIGTYFTLEKNRYQSTTNKQKMLVKQNKNADTRKGCNASAISYRLSNI